MTYQTYTELYNDFEEVAEHALDLMGGDESLVLKWFDTPVPRLDGKRPSELNDDEGKELLEQLLTDVDGGFGD